MVQTFPLDGRSLEQRIQEAKGLLKEHGYSVRGPLLEDAEIANITNQKFPYRLRSYFFDTMLEYNPSYTFGYTGNVKEDLGIASRLLRKLEDEECIGRRQAMVLCMRIVDTLFKYEDLIGLNGKITSMRVLSPGDKTGWIVERAKSIINGVDKEVFAIEDKLWYDTLYRCQEEAIYKEEEASNGKKES